MALPHNLLPRLYRHLMLERCISDAGMQDFEECVERLCTKYSDDAYGEGTETEIRRAARLASCFATQLLADLRTGAPGFTNGSELPVLRGAAQMLSTRTGLSYEDSYYALDSIVVLVRFGFPGGL